jgi:formylglycine-generating enzyme required for sulfatase activity
LGWYVDEVRGIGGEITAALDAGAFDRIGRQEAFQAKREAVREYLERFPEGQHAAKANRLADSLDREEILYGNFDRAQVFWQQLSFGREYLDRFAEGFWAAAVQAKLEAMLAKEKAAAEAILDNSDVEEVLTEEKKFWDQYSGGPHARRVRERVRRADEERRAFQACEDGIRNCTDYLSRYPRGWYRERVEGLVRTFAWPAEDNGGIGYNGRLPPGLNRADSVGEYVSAADGAVMIYTPKGFFPMGSDDWRERSCDRPQFMAWVAGYFIDKYEVTNRQYRRFLEWMRKAKDPHRFCHPDEPKGKDHTPALWKDPKWNGDALPVVGVDWFDAYAFARWAGRQLPTEAQWEKAASADVLRRRKFRWPWGNERPEPGMCHFGKKEEEGGGTVAVESYPGGQSPLGAFQMAGNVAEWCLDAFDPDFYDRFSPGEAEAGRWATNPFNGKTAPIHTIRGGHWAEKDFRLITTRRRGVQGRSNRVGFRCAMWSNPSFAKEARARKR